MAGKLTQHIKCKTKQINSGLKLRYFKTNEHTRVL